MRGSLCRFDLALILQACVAGSLPSSLLVEAASLPALASGCDVDAKPCSLELLALLLWRISGCICFIFSTLPGH